MLLLEDGFGLLLENGTDKLTEETPPNPGDISLESGDRILLENGTDSLIKEESTSSSQNLDIAFVSSGETLYSPNVSPSLAVPFISAGSAQYEPALVQNAVNSALRIDGEQDALQLSTRPNVSNITFTGWARIAVDRNTYSGIFSIETGVGHSVEWNELITETDGTTLSVYDHITGNVGTVGVMTVGVWYRVAISITSSGTYSAYFGTEGSATLTKTTGTLTNISVNDYTGIGATSFASTEWFNGRLALPRVWNAVLSDAEIEREFKSYTPVRTSDLLGAWIPRDVTTGTVLNAISGADLIDGDGGGIPDYTIEAGPVLVQQMDVGQLASGAVTYVPTVTTAGQNLTVPQIASTETLYAASLSNVNTLTVPQVASTEAQYSPSLSNLNTLTAPQISSGEALYSATLTQGATLAPPILASTEALFGPTVSNLSTVTVPQIASGSTQYNPALSLSVLAPFLASGEQIYSPSVTNLNVLTAGLLGPDSAVYAATTTNVNTLTVPQIGSTASLFEPSVSWSLTAPQIAAGSTQYNPTLTNINSLVVPQIASTATLFGPSMVDVLTVPQIGSGSNTYAPTVDSSYSLSLGLLGPDSALYSPVVTQDAVLLQVPLLGPDSTTYAPSVAALSTLLAPLLNSTSQVYSPNVQRNLNTPSITSSEAVYSPSVAAFNELTLPLLGPDSVLYTCSLGGLDELAVPAIASTEQTFAPGIVSVISPPSIVSAESIYNPALTTRNALDAPFIASGEVVYGPSVSSVLSAPQIGSTEAVYDPRLGFIIYVPRISTAIPYPPTVTNLNTFEVPNIPSTSSQFAPTVNLGVSAPVIVSGAVYPPTITPGLSPAVLYGNDNALPLIRTLELPLPATVTQIVGIHQSDIVIRSAIEAALADMRANHWLLDYVFASMPQDTLTWKEYGEKDLQEAKKWFMTTHIPVSVLPRMNESKWPQITIELMESSEVVPETTIGDVNYDPNEANDRTWPALTPAFTPISYVPSTGVIKLAGECEAWLGPGMYLVDRQGRAHEIVEVTDQTQFKIDPGTVADFRGCVIKGHRPNWNVSVESSSFKETYRIGIHVQNEPAHLTWLHAIMQFALLRYKQVLLEGRGFERSTISSSQIGVDQRFEAENIFTRFITINGYVRQFWPKTVAPVIDGVELDQLQVSGQNADVSVERAGVDPLTQLWVGNLDTLRRR